MKIKPLNLIFVLESIIFSLLAVEFILRASFLDNIIEGHKWKITQGLRNEPVMFEPDAELGWKSKIGRYIIPAYTKGSPDIVVTLWPGNLRATQPIRTEKNRRIALVGCSFVFGWAISDWETLAWKLQKTFPGVEFMNYGVGGYSTYQSLLLLRKIFAASPKSIELVFYGLLVGHEDRNVGDWIWLKTLGEYSHRGHVKVPYCTLAADNALIEHLPESYPVWRINKYSRLATLVERLYVKFKTRAREQQKQAVTEAIIKEMDDLCRRNNSKLIILLLYRESKYNKFLQDKGIYFIDCWPPDYDYSKYHVQEEGHPNGALNSFWSEKVAEKMKRDFGY